MATTTYPGDVILTDLSLALWLIDDFTQKKAVGPVTMIIKENGVKAAQNLSGYYFFTNLAKGHYTVVSESEFYHPAEVTVDTTTLAPKNPVHPIVLKPRPHYPFPGSATLLRGVVTNSAPVSGADVTVTGKTIATLTDDHGEFVLYFKGIKKETVTVAIKKGADIKSITATVEEGKTFSTGIIHFP